MMPACSVTALSGRTSQTRRPWDQTAAAPQNFRATDCQYITVPKHLNKPSDSNVLVLLLAQENKQWKHKHITHDKKYMVIYKYGEGLNIDASK
jgi:hypothetical protein